MQGKNHNQTRFSEKDLTSVFLGKHLPLQPTQYHRIRNLVVIC